MAHKKTRAPETTLKETEYLKALAAAAKPVGVKLDDGRELTGVVEFFDATFLRLTREGEPNLFLFKDRVKYLWELDSSSSV
ncbi:MAG: Sm ribonucleo-like protein [Acidobacteria bacterium]|nr:Sm ribonucleo-like protein [Acidobacteriota bacterium]